MCEVQESFEFKPVNPSVVSGFLRKVSTKKATGVDGLSAKILKIVEPAIVVPLTNVINDMFSKSKFPDQLKKARVTPVYKKKDRLNKEFYRPISILPIMSKFFEWSISSQLTRFFDGIFDPRLSAYRRGYSCESVLLGFIENVRSEMDKKNFCGAILMDLSKAFDCLPHDLVAEKLKAYKMSPKALTLLTDYLKNRQQCVRVGGCSSTFQSIVKGVPQGSILGPLIFNIFLNDIFARAKQCKLANYADDNTLSYSNPDFEMGKQILETEAESLVDWFEENGMQANPGKFQSVVFSTKNENPVPSFNIKGVSIPCTTDVKLLGVDIDSKLNFSKHVSSICRKAGQQLNALRRIGKNLNFKCRKLIYHSFVMSTFDFCPLAWNFCGKTNERKLEQLNFRALKFVYDNYSYNYDDLLTKDNSVTLKLRRTRKIALEVYKIIEGRSPKFLNELIKLQSTGRYDLRGSETRQLEAPSDWNMKWYKNSFCYQSVQIWNSLPHEIRLAENYKTFKRLISHWNGEVCKCAMCRS